MWRLRVQYHTYRPGIGRRAQQSHHNQHHEETHWRQHMLRLSVSCIHFVCVASWFVVALWWQLSVQRNNGGSNYTQITRT